MFLPGWWDLYDTALFRRVRVKSVRCGSCSTSHSFPSLRSAFKALVAEASEEETKAKEISDAKARAEAEAKREAAAEKARQAAAAEQAASSARKVRAIAQPAFQSRTHFRFENNTLGFWLIDVR